MSKYYLAARIAWSRFTHGELEMHPSDLQANRDKCIAYLVDKASRLADSFIN